MMTEWNACQKNSPGRQLVDAQTMAAPGPQRGVLPEFADAKTRRHGTGEARFRFKYPFVRMNEYGFAVEEQKVRIAEFGHPRSKTAKYVKPLGRRVRPMRYVLQRIQQHQERQFGVSATNALSAQFRRKIVDTIQCAVMCEMMHPSAVHSCERMGVRQMRFALGGASDMRDQVSAWDLAFNDHPGKRTVRRGRGLAEDVGVTILCKNDPPARAIAVPLATLSGKAVQRVFHDGRSRSAHGEQLAHHIILC